MSLTDRVVKFIAARVHVPGDAIDYYLASGHIGQPSQTALPFPSQLIPIGTRLALRGWLNRQFLPTHRDWILPYWAERQLDPKDPAFVPPGGFSLFALNYTHRDWTMIGSLARAREAIVDPRGLVTPWLDGWSLDVWLEVDGALFAPSRLPASDVEQMLRENMPMVSTVFGASGLQVRSEAFAVEEEDESEWVVHEVSVENPSSSRRSAVLYLSVRPFNPEGVSLVKKIQYWERPERAVFLVNDALGIVMPKPDGVACSDLKGGDVALALPTLNGKTAVQDDSGLATAVAAYSIELGPGETRSLAARMPMEREELDEEERALPSERITNLSAVDARARTIAAWHDKLGQGMRVRVPDEKLQNAFEANKAYLLLLHDGGNITPGPFTYHQFWFRDAAYLLNALDKLGYHDEARQVLESYPRRMQNDGYMQATEGEWDSNGAAIWAWVENARLSGSKDLVARNYWKVLTAASWINSKRHQAAPGSQRGGLHKGLLPPGPGPEHLGPNDWFYWDDFWGLAGLREAARVADWLGQEKDAARLRANYESFRGDVDASLAGAAARVGRAAMPAAPNRRLDAGMIGSLAALYPLRLFEPDDPRIVDTLAALAEKAQVGGAFFNHVGHSAFGTYLSLHIAECYLFQRRAEAWDIIQWMLDRASPTFAWAEGLHPITLRGGMGDGHHGWALADFLLMVRNALLFEEGDHLVITPVLPLGWTVENNVVQVEGAATYFGRVDYTIAFGERTGTLAFQGDWHASPEFVEWDLPFPLREAGGEVEGIEIVGNKVRLPPNARRVVVTW